jgi:hypothetical protein
MHGSHVSGSGCGEPGHLHLDRETRRWLVHAADGTLQPYRGSADPGSPAVATPAELSTTRPGTS